MRESTHLPKRINKTTAALLRAVRLSVRCLGSRVLCAVLLCSGVHGLDVLSPRSTAFAQDPYSSRTAAEWRRELADSKYEVLRRRAAYVLGRLDGGKTTSETEANAEALAAALKDRDLVVRWYAADSLGRLGPIAAPAMQRMVAGLTDATNDKDVRRNLAKSLGRIGKPDPEATKQLKTAVDGDDKLFAIAAAAALIRLGEGGDAYDKLLQFAEQPEPIVAFAALRAMEELRELR